MNFGTTISSTYGLTYVRTLFDCHFEAKQCTSSTQIYKEISVYYTSNFLGMRDGLGPGNELFLYCRNCDSRAVVVVAHFDPHLAGSYLARQKDS